MKLMTMCDNPDIKKLADVTDGTGRITAENDLPLITHDDQRFTVFPDAPDCTSCRQT